MRLSEFEHSSTNTPESNLLTALELIRNRYNDQDKLPKISTQSLINMVLNTDKTFNYDSLVAANDTNPAVKNLIKSYNKDYVELRSADEAQDDEGYNTPDVDSPVDVVPSMAKKAAKKRDVDLF
jgi:hypothetical protein